MDAKYAFLGVFGLAVGVAIVGVMAGKQSEHFGKDPLQRSIQKSLKEQAEKDATSMGMGLNLQNQASGLAYPSVETAVNPEPTPTDSLIPPMAPPAGAVGAPATVSPITPIAPYIPPPSPQTPTSGAPVAIVPPTPTAGGATPYFPAFTLANGKPVYFYGENVYTSGDNGQMIPLADGNYTLKDGQALVVKQGKRQINIGY